MAITKFLLPLLAAAGSAIAADLPPIQIKGSKFFYENGTQFFIKGVAYQQDSSPGGSTASTNTTYTDPLSSQDNCERDVPLLQELGANVIRTYQVDPKGDHKACMNLLNDAGIYVISDLANPDESINRENPAWTTDLYDHYAQVIDNFSQYPNVIGFFVGNEVTNNGSNTDASAYVKAAARDMKKYIKDKGYKNLAVGYAADDTSDLRDNIANYFNCGDEAESVDFFGYNVYEWCGDSNFETSGYNRILEFFKSYSIPVFFAEYGCNTVGGAAGRTFTETPAIYAENMSQVLSGGIVYEYFQAKRDYGLVELSGDKATKMKDFAAFQKQIAKVDPKGVSMSDYSPSNKPRDCPTVNSTWESSSTLPPTPNKDACSCMVKAASCVPSKNLDPSGYETMFNYICGNDKKACAGINRDTSKGEYGAYSMCADKDKLTYVLNAYYADQKQASDACDFDGNATTQTADGKISSCDKLAKTQPSNNGSDGDSAAVPSAIAGGSQLYTFLALSSIAMIFL